MIKKKKQAIYILKIKFVLVFLQLNLVNKLFQKKPIIIF